MFSKLFFFLLTTTFIYAYPTYSDALKEKKLYPLGKKIYVKHCNKIDPKAYTSYEQMKDVILSKKICKDLNPLHLDALSLYLWDITRNDIHQHHYPKLVVTKAEKCPVCGMFLYKYPTWVSRINYKDKSVAFDGIKDMMKYYFENSDTKAEMLVQEYYTGKTINAREAFFVLGSDIYGPMGNELIAFDDEKSAEQFMLDHKAKEILPFELITEEKVYNLDR